MTVRLQCLAAFALVLAAGFTFYFVHYGQLFLLIEYRQWTEEAYFWSELSAVLGAASHLDGATEFSRHTGLLFATFFTALFGHEPQLHNAANILLVVFSAALLVPILRKLFGANGVVAGGIAAMYLLLCIPAVDSIAWQATLLDKVSLFFAAVTLTFAVAIQPKIGGVRRAVIINAVFLVLYAFAYNAKEAAWAIAPAVAMFIFIRAKAAGGRWLDAGVTALVLTGLPLLHATAHVFEVYANIALGGLDGRLLSGDVLFNIQTVFAYLTNEWVGDVGAIRINVAIGATVIALGVAASLRSAARRSGAYYILAAFLAFVMATVIPIRTAVVSPFYLLVPNFYLALCLGVSLAALMNAFSRRQSAVAVAVVMVGVGFLAARQWSEGAFYRQVASYSPHFQRALAQIRDEIAETDPMKVTIVYDGDIKRAYMYTEQGRLSPYLLAPGRPRAERLAFDQRVNVVTFSARPDLEPEPGELVAVLDGRLGLQELIWRAVP